MPPQKVTLFLMFVGQAEEALNLYTSLIPGSEIETLERFPDGTVYKATMEPADYGFSRKFAWVADRFGVAWQLNLP